MLMPFIMFLVFVCVVILWFAGGHLFYNNWWMLGDIFGENGWENTFSPINALFSALASGGALCAIISQGTRFKTQQFENNFFNMLDMHRDNAQQIHIDIYCNHEHNSKDPFYDAYTLLTNTYSIIVHDSPTSLLDKYNDKVTTSFGKRLTSIFDGDSISTDDKKIFKMCHNVLRDSARESFDKYFKHLYRLAKYTYDHAPLGKRKEYAGIIRAQLSSFEQIIIYYHCLQDDDIHLHRNCSKFQHLVEQLCLMHNINTKYIFDDGAAGKYSPEAFNRPITFLPIYTPRHAPHFLYWRFDSNRPTSKLKPRPQSDISTIYPFHIRNRPQ